MCGKLKKIKRKLNNEKNEKSVWTCSLL